MDAPDLDISLQMRYKQNPQMVLVQGLKLNKAGRFGVCKLYCEVTFLIRPRLKKQ